MNGTPFQALARAIAHQQLNGTAANTILTRFINTVGGGTFPRSSFLQRPKPPCAPRVSRSRRSLH
jgi:3-methyladenine DNA glycosylase/8-oxoguanine DNA glycosylase